MDTKQRGEVSEAKVLAHLKSIGLTVLTPFGDNAKYDLVCDTDDGFVRVQVKTGKLQDNGAIIFNTATRGHNMEDAYQKEYDSNDIDVFVVFCPQVDEYYAVDVEDAPSSQMSLRVEPPGNGQTKGVNMAKEFDLTERFI